MTELLVDHSDGRYQEIIEHANKTEQQESLQNAFRSLFRRILRGECVKLYSDYAPLSMYFVCFDKNERQTLNGGIIYHGSHDGFGSGAAPTFSVTLEKTKGWACHT